ncbi:MAG: MFS transporter [Candidatus Heimdallarchaeota archaeon]
MNTTLKSRFLDTLPPKNLLPLLIGYLIEHIAISNYWTFFGISLKEDLDLSWVGLAAILLTPGLVSILGTSILSAVSDRIGRRKEIMLFSRIFLVGQYILLIFYYDSSLWINLAILASFGLITQAYYIMHTALLTTICHPDKRGKVTSFQVLFASAGWMIGSGISGVININFGMQGNLIFAASFALLSGFIVMFSPTKPWGSEQKDADEFETQENSESEIEKSQTEDTPIRTLAKLPKDNREKIASYWEIFKRKEVLTLIIALAILDFGFGPFSVIGGNYSILIGFSKNYVALSNVIATVLGLVITLIMSRVLDRHGRKPFLIFAFIAYPIVYSLMFALSNYWVAIFIIYSYPLYAVKMPTANTIMSDITSDRERARGMSLISFEQIIASGIGALIACFIADNVSQGILITPLFPMVFGLIAIVVAILIVKETNKKYLEMKAMKKAQPSISSD